MRWVVVLVFLLNLATSAWCVEWEAAMQDAAFLEVLDEGEFTRAEEALQLKIDDPAGPVTSKEAIQVEVLRRLRLAFPYTDETMLAEVRKHIPDVTSTDLGRWRDSGDLQYRLIDGQRCYFERAISNLFRFNAEARERRKTAPTANTRFDWPRHLEVLRRHAQHKRTAEIYPVRHTIRYTVTVSADHPRVKPGAVVRAWLPFPQEYRQQRDVRLIRTQPDDATITQNGAAHRTLFFSQTIADPPESPQFAAEFEFTTFAYWPRLDPSAVQPYQVDSALYRKYTASRPPHIVITPYVEQLAREIVGSETNPLEKVRRIFRWTSENIPWCAEMEYSVVPSLSEKGLKAKRGDCGVQGLVFVTLCRAAGIPARWQSGFQLQPGNWNLHDWSEFYIEPWGWLPADVSYGMQDHPDPEIQYFFCGAMDSYRWIINLDYGRALEPEKTSFRSEPNDFQRGEVEIDGHNLYFDEWDWTIEITSKPEDIDHARAVNDAP